MYEWSPRNGDELMLEEGDDVEVMERCDDGWYVGLNRRSKRFGTFPGNYVEKLWSVYHTLTLCFALNLLIDVFIFSFSSFQLFFVLLSPVR